jgi:glycosyltransferase involved in cell wall biosynthesis
MKIVFVSYYYWPPHFGGELVIGIERFEFLAKQGHDITVLTSGLEGYSSYEMHNRIKVFRCPPIGESKIARGLRRLGFPFWVISRMWSEGFDILHLGDTGGIDQISKNLAGWIICKFARYRKSKIVFVHSLADTEQEMFTENGFDRRLRKLYLDQCDDRECHT